MKWKRPARGNHDGGKALRLFFASDIHGSEVCLRKWVNSVKAYNVDILVLGGDITGKAVIPIVAHEGSWVYLDHGETRVLETETELSDAKKVIRSRGSYGIVIESEEEREALATPEGS
jgi:Icc-related predicted phosphoesterase